MPNRLYIFNKYFDTKRKYVSPKNKTIIYLWNEKILNKWIKKKIYMNENVIVTNIYIL